MGVISKQQLDVIWEDNGLKDRMGRFRQFLKERGLYAHITAEKIQDHFYEILEAYFVKGLKESADGQRTSRTPGDAVGDEEGEGQAG